uniref:Uncharacterized protein n=1 Tax=Setaria digitata TaxID=48799 RepID=A0A915PPV0_9BILA
MRRTNTLRVHNRYVTIPTISEREMTNGSESISLHHAHQSDFGVKSFKYIHFQRSFVRKRHIVYQVRGKLAPRDSFAQVGKLARMSKRNSDEFGSKARCLEDCGITISQSASSDFGDTKSTGSSYKAETTIQADEPPSLPSESLEEVLQLQN